MQDRLVIGNDIINLLEVESTNEYLKQHLTENVKLAEGLVVTTNNQTNGKGQRGASWESESNKNLTFSIFLSPNVLVSNQFDISKLVAVSVAETLSKMGVENVKVKWPNDIYCVDKKVGGILIENVLKKNKVSRSVVGVGLNINQTKFSKGLLNPTSVVLELDSVWLDLRVVLDEILGVMDKNYLLFKSGNANNIAEEYTSLMYRLNEFHQFEIDGVVVEGKILGVNSICID
jgi:BirA family biotin operon repressor/biotin-[acetyl-CoA-carboxylase] ligase